MDTYKIELIIDDREVTQNWGGWSEQSAIAQAFLYNAQQGVRKIEALNITLL